MQKKVYSLFAVLGVLWLVLTLTGCRDYARHFRPPVVEAGTFRARALLTVEQRRAFDKFYLEALRQKLKGNDDAAFELLNQALAINPNASEALYEQSRILLQLDLPQDSDLVAKGDAMLLKAYRTGKSLHSQIAGDALDYAKKIRSCSTYLRGNHR